MRFPKIPPKKADSEYLSRIFKAYISNSKFRELVKEYNEKYIYWEKLYYKNIPRGISREDIWHMMKLERMKNLKSIKIGKYRFCFNLTSSTLEKLHNFDLNLGGSLTVNGIIPSDEIDRFLINSIIEESINSSRLEGASTTIKVAKDMILNRKKPKDKSQKMILNNFLAMKRILDLKGEKLTKEILLELHQIITSKTLEKVDYEGKFRNTDEIKVADRITGEVYHIPPSKKELGRLIDDFCDFYNNEQKFFIHPIIKANILHFLLGYIHPFYDGNGRCARCIFFLYLISNNYWLFEYISISRIIIKSHSQYSKAYVYSEIDDNDLTYFINYKVDKIELAFNDLRAYIERKLKEKRSSMKFLKYGDLTERQAQILGFYESDKNRIFSVLEISQRFVITKQTARSDLQKLVNLGFLIEKSAGNRSIFIRSDKFNSIVNNGKSL